MRYEPFPQVTYDVSGLSDKWLERCYRRLWDRIDYRYGQCSWDWPTLCAVYPGFASLIQCLKTEARKRRSNA
jgi:hypothetical protein